MNKILYITVFLITLFSCRENKQQDLDINSQNLKESFDSKNENEFLYQFPKDFDGFKQYFGWDDVNDKPQYLYNDANKYITYWISLLNKHKEHEKDIINVCKNGNWEPDAVNFLQYKTLEFIKNNKKYYLINDLSVDEAKSVLFFLFDKPQPKLDVEFNTNLTSEKKKIVQDLFETAYFDYNENPDPEEVLLTYTISQFEGTEHYFIREIDIDNDGVLDKIVSADPYQGDELFLFINKKDNYDFALKTTNFSEDGGNQIVNILKSENGFEIFTAFPDRGLLEAHHHIKFINKKWMLTHTIYRTESSNEEEAFIYNCTVSQNIDLSDEELLDKLKLLPNEEDKNKDCVKEFISH